MTGASVYQKFLLAMKVLISLMMIRDRRGNIIDPRGHRLNPSLKVITGLQDTLYRVSFILFIMEDIAYRIIITKNH